MMKPPRAYKKEEMNPEYQYKELSDHSSEGEHSSDSSKEEWKNKESESRQQIISTENSPAQAKNHSQI